MEPDEIAAPRGLFERWKHGLSWKLMRGGARMTKKEAERAIGELLNSYQSTLSDTEKRCKLVDGLPSYADLSEEDWQMRDASIARIDAICQVLELLNYAVWRGTDGGWLVRQG